MLPEKIQNMTVKEFLNTYVTVYDGCHAAPMGIIKKEDGNIIKNFIPEDIGDELHTEPAIPFLNYLNIIPKQKLYDMISDELFNLDLDRKPFQEYMKTIEDQK